MNDLQVNGTGHKLWVLRTNKIILLMMSGSFLYIGYVPGFPGAHTQGETLDELNKNLKEVIEMLIEDGPPDLEAEFVGTQTVMVA